MFGFDNEDRSVFERTVEFVDRVKIDLPRYAVATPFPGTALYQQWEMESRLLHKNWELYDVEHVVFQPRQMSPEQLQEGLDWSWRQSYSWRSCCSRMTAAKWSSLPLWISLNFGYRHFARTSAENGYHLSRPAVHGRSRVQRDRTLRRDDGGNEMTG